MEKINMGNFFLLGPLITYGFSVSVFDFFGFH